MKFDAQVDFRGSRTKQVYAGIFSGETDLSWNQILAESNTYRRRLDYHPETAPPDAQSVAYAWAYLSVRVTDAPDWWAKTQGGLETRDDNVLSEVMKAVSAEVKRIEDAAAKKASAAADEAKAAADPLK